MQYKKQEIMDKIFKYAEEYYLSNHSSPSTSQIAKGTGVCRATVYNYLVAMNERGILSYDGKTISTDNISKVNSSGTKANIVGSISCGIPIGAEESIEEYVTLPSAIFGKNELYILRASGNSMVDAGINSGDLVVIRKQETAEDGDIVVALVDNENTLKRYYKDAENKCFILHPENKQLEDIIVKDLVIQGVAQQVIKNL